MISGTVFLFIFAFFKQRCDGAPIKHRVFVPEKKFPDFMQNLYHRFLAGRAPFSDIIHSNAAIAVKRSNASYEATFAELDFLQSEDLKRARLRFDIPQPKHCSLPELNIKVMDGISHQIVGNYVMLPQKNGLNTFILTKSLEKLTRNFNTSNELKIRITVRNPNTGQNLCSNVVDSLSSEVYLVTNTDEVKTKKRRSADFKSRMLRRDAEDPSMFRSVAKGRSKRQAPKCTMNKVYVNLTSANNSIFILPTGFKTGVCGLQQPVPLGSDPMIQALASAIARAIKGVAPTSNPSCCMPSRFQKLTVLYFEPSNVSNVHHTVLRHVDNVVVKRCACSNKT